MVKETTSPAKSPRKPSTSRSPKKAATGTNTPTKTELKKKWAEHIANNQWKRDRTFFHPDKVRTVTQGDAQCLDDVKPRLKPEELATLPHERRISPASGHEMKLYSVSDVRRLIRERAIALKLPISVPKPSLCTLNPEADNLLGRLSYRSKALVRHLYVPPPGSSDQDPVPEDIIWEGEHVWGDFGIEVHDACLLYCLKPEDLKEFTEASRWLDIRSVAVQALEVHGGLTKHNQIIIERRKKDMKTIEELGQARKYQDEKPLVDYSKGLRDFLKSPLMPNPEEFMQERQAISREEMLLRKRRTVKQYGPIVYVGMDDYGCEWQWFHGSKRLSDDDLEL
ncbi:hypothetical protein VNI00_005969 [Paramarasmius palmivorus]|uniref:Uncharacterized protein n=1 Tax=Paramarasmius palmivorus TaxID=297713 RepID=A0AAW0DD46_9AGAR